MMVDGRHYRTIWVEDSGMAVGIIDQRMLPHKFVTEKLRTVDDACRAIKDMHVRGAPLIGATAAFGMHLAALEAPKNEKFESFMENAARKLISTRPTAVDLSWAVERQMEIVRSDYSPEEKAESIYIKANDIADESAEMCRMIGESGKKIIEEISEKKEGCVNILTHCNAGWLACVDYGTALAPVYVACDAGIDVHVWVDETRPRNQGARLTAWELGKHGVPHTVIADNAGGHLMQHGMVDIVIVGADRVGKKGDVANKIGTYLKALAAKDNGVPFYVAFPSSTIDREITDGIKEIPIEERSENEVKYIQGLCEGEIKKVLLTPKESPAKNYAFDVTPARLITGYITEKGVFESGTEF